MVLRSDGSINWIPPYLLTTTCKIDHTWFPFDKQNCRIKLGSWSNTAKQINLQEREREMDLGSYVMNLDWHLESAEGSLSEISYGPGSTYQSMTFVIGLQRRSLASVSQGLTRQNWVLVRSGLLTVVNILGFLMPATHPSPRLLLLFISLVALSVTSGNIPQSSLMATLLGSCTFTLILAAVHTVFVASLANSRSLLLACNPILPDNWAVKEESLKEQTLKITWWIDFAAFWVYLIVFTSYFLVTIVNGIESQLVVDP